MSDKDIRALAADALDDAADAVNEAKKLNKKAEAVIDKIETAFGGDEWQKQLHDISEVAKSLKEGNSSASPEKITEIVKGIMDAQDVERKARGLMADGNPVSSQSHKALDPWNKSFDIESYNYRSRRVDFKSMDKRELLNMAFTAPAFTDLEKSFQHAYTDLMIADQIIRAREGHNYRGFRHVLPKMTAMCDELRGAMLSDLLQTKASVDPNDIVDTAAWIPTVFSNEFREMVWLETRVEGLFETITVSGAGTNWVLPWDNTDYIANRVPLATSTGYTTPMGTTFAMTNPFQATNPIDLGTNIDDKATTFQFQMHRGRGMFQGMLDEDSIIAIMPRMRANILRSIARGAEQAIINGQATDAAGTAAGTALDVGDVLLTNGTTTTWTNEAIFDVRFGTAGLRKIARAQSTTVSNSGAAISSTSVMKTLPKLMGKFGINPAQKALIVGPIGYTQLLMDTNVITQDKYGPQATIFSGALGMVGGVPIIVSEHASQVLDNTGVIPTTGGSAGAFTAGHLVYRPGFINVEKRAISIGADYYRATDVTDVVAMRRWQFGKVYHTTATATVCAEIYNVANAA